MGRAENRQADIIRSFNLQPGRLLAGKYKITQKLGAGWEGEVYLVEERATGIERAAKIFFPQRNQGGKAVKLYARKLHKLRHCPFIIQYHTQEMLRLRGLSVSCLISEFVAGELLWEFIKRQPGGRLMSFQAVHLLHALVQGVECVHVMGDYHGDLHSKNIIVQRFGLNFELRLLDIFHWGSSRTENIQDDIINLIHIFYEALGGRKYYAQQPQVIKSICCGLKRSLILKKFKSASKLRTHLEKIEWD